MAGIMKNERPETAGLPCMDYRIIGLISTKGVDTPNP
jgi:hypothetical protein